jgi:hypothetical protein
MMMNTKPRGTNTVNATFDGVTITFYSYACNAYEVYNEAVELFHRKGLRDATINNISVGVW